MTQIGQRLRISQMRVSGLITHALGYLRSRLLEMEEHASYRRSGGGTQAVKRHAITSLSLPDAQGQAAGGPRSGRAW